MTIIIGLTGGIASGKTDVSKHLKKKRFEPVSKIEIKLDKPLGSNGNGSYF